MQTITPPTPEDPSDDSTKEIRDVMDELEKEISPEDNTDDASPSPDQDDLAQKRTWRENWKKFKLSAGLILFLIFSIWFVYFVSTNSSSEISVKEKSQSDELRALPGTYYLKTLAGFEFSNQPKRHPLFRARFLPVTQAIQKEYNKWLESGLLIVPAIPEDGLYYDPGTGAPIAWCVIREATDGQPEMRVSPLPGYDPKTSRILKIIDENLANSFDPLPLECFSQEKREGVTDPYFLLKTSPGELSLHDASVVIEKAAQVNVYNN